jgi:hypothetical protein
MSGGYFDFNQHRVREIAEDIERLIATNDDETKNEWGNCKGRGYSPEIIERFREAVHTLNQAADMAQRVDWLVSDDDGPESFLRRWNTEVRGYWNEKLDSGCAE